MPFSFSRELVQYGQILQTLQINSRIPIIVSTQNDSERQNVAKLPKFQRSFGKQPHDFLQKAFHAEHFLDLGPDHGFVALSTYHPC